MENIRHDIASLEDIILFVNEFYGKVQQDDLIGPVFNAAIKNWEPHLQQMYAFWNAVLFGAAGFRGNPFAKHAPLPISVEHFERWLQFFRATITSNFEGEKAEEAIERSEIMAELFLSKLQHMNGDPRKVIV